VPILIKIESKVMIIGDFYELLGENFRFFKDWLKT